MEIIEQGIIRDFLVEENLEKKFKKFVLKHTDLREEEINEWLTSEDLQF